MINDDKVVNKRTISSSECVLLRLYTAQGPPSGGEAANTVNLHHYSWGQLTAPSRRPVSSFCPSFCIFSRSWLKVPCSAVVELGLRLHVHGYFEKLKTFPSVHALHLRTENSPLKIIICKNSGQSGDFGCNVQTLVVRCEMRFKLWVISWVINWRSMCQNLHLSWKCDLCLHFYLAMVIMDAFRRVADTFMLVKTLAKRFVQFLLETRERKWFVAVYAIFRVLIG